MARERKAVDQNIEKSSKELSELEQLRAEITKRMGEGTINKANKIPDTSVIDSGIFTLDYALLGGLSESSINMVYGYEGSGKTTVAMRYIAGALRKHPESSAVFVDLEGTFDTKWAKAAGIEDVSRIEVVRTNNGEDAVDIIEAMLGVQQVSIVVLDSIPAVNPINILEKSAEDNTMAERARLLGKMCSKVISALIKERKRDHKPVFLMINQFRDKVGALFGDTRELPGGKQPRYACQTMIEIKKIKENVTRSELGDEIPDYNDTGFKIKKHKAITALTSGEFKLVRNPEHPLGSGAIDEVATVVTFAKKFGFVTGGGSSWRLQGVDQKFGRLSEIYSHLYDNPLVFHWLKKAIISARRVELGYPELPKDGYLLGWD